jgi:hypothetical protein
MTGLEIIFKIHVPFDASFGRKNQNNYSYHENDIKLKNVAKLYNHICLNSTKYDFQFISEYIS